MGFSSSSRCSRPAASRCADSSMPPTRSTRERIARGLLSVSAGNAALACAYVAHALHVPCRVVMYDNAPAPKIDGVRALGAEPVLLPRERRGRVDRHARLGRPAGGVRAPVRRCRCHPRSLIDRSRDPRRLSGCRARARAGGRRRADLRRRARIRRAQARRAGGRRAVRRISLVAARRSRRAARLRLFPTRLPTARRRRSRT